MTVVVVAGPATITAAVRVDPEVVRTAFDAIDDRLAVVDDEIVPVRELWCRIAAVAVPDRSERVTLVVPSSWVPARVELVEDAMLTVCGDVIVRRRADVLRMLASDVVELGCHDTADEIVASVRGAAAVVLDIPIGVAGLGPLALEVERRLERVGVAVIRANDDTVWNAVGTDPPAPLPRFAPARVLAAVAAVAITAALVGAAFRSPPERTVDGAGKWIFEGRVAVEVGADWEVSRVVHGPGSARLQAVSPDGVVTLHVTQAVVPRHETREGTARALDAALSRQPQGVFTAFDPGASAAGRDAVTYRETRSGVVDWTVLVDDGIRIAVGCRDGSGEPRRGHACERAISTARAVRGIDER